MSVNKEPTPQMTSSLLHSKHDFKETQLSSLFASRIEKSLTFEDWLKLMPGSTFAGREEWEVNDMLFRLEEIIVYSRDYLLTTTYPDGPSEQMKNKNPEEYKKMQKDNQFTVSLTRDLMACVDIFKKIPYPKNKEAEAL